MLLTLGQRLPEGNAEDLTASLPIEVNWYLTGTVHEHAQRFDWSEFVHRVSEIDGRASSEAASHARVGVDLVHPAIPESDFRQLRDMLPERQDDGNWHKLSELVDAGGLSDAGEAYKVDQKYFLSTTR